MIPGSGRSTGEGIGYSLQHFRASLVVQLVKYLPAMREMWLRTLGWEDPLEKGKATHTNILGWRIPWRRKELDITERLSLLNLEVGSKITADGDCSHEIKRRFLLGRKLITNLDSILKSRHYFANRGLFSQGYGFSSGHVWM